MMPHGEGGGGAPGPTPPPPPPPTGTLPRNEPVLTEYARRSRWRPRQPACQNGEGLLQNAPARLPRPICPAVPGGDARMGEGVRTFPASVADDGFPNFFFQALMAPPPLPPSRSCLFCKIGLGTPQSNRTWGRSIRGPLHEPTLGQNSGTQ